ncbi:MAG: tRNA (adenosine(37)-N6)-threonylcarbamoyltransferase complex dimerization subunit type 1 TsaB [Aminivibrio sp.]|jgi:tRNA threonylcarbamoyl adenosine modification protein YeaZ|nr:tRNA (adenosine(37)-N6)-threonylcarbamoyltransferase complex dimerization subunit type 1 TsaB [Aminivibrio sp.]
MSQHILSINCSNARWTTLGLLDGTAVSGEMNLELGKRQSSILPSLVDFFLGTFSLRVDDVDFFAVVTGPGSFTGLKVAVAFTQFLAWASGEKPIIPLSSLECLAYTILDRSKQPVCPLLWAGGGKVYSALFIPGAAGEAPKEPVPPKAYDREELLEALLVSGTEVQDVLFLSDTPEKCGRLFSGSFPGPVETASPRGAADVLLAGLYKHRAIPPRAVTAQYFREPDIG